MMACACHALVDGSKPRDVHAADGGDRGGGAGVSTGAGRAPRALADRAGEDGDAAAGGVAVGGWAAGGERVAGIEVTIAGPRFSGPW